MIVPTYHRNDLLHDCLSALAPSVQTIDASEYEVIVTDDGKSSTAEALIRDEFPWARWVAGPQKGPAANRNSGAKQVKGKWLIFTDDDCVPSPGFIAGYKEAVAVSDALAYEGKTTCEEGIPSPMYTSPINISGGCFWSCNIMMERGLFQQMDGFNEQFAVASNEDTDLRERLRAKKIQIQFAPQAAVNHPPRPRISGAKAGRLRETIVQMWYMTGNRSATKISAALLRTVVAENIMLSRQHPLSKNTVVFLVYGVSEFVYVATHLSQWNRRYREAYAHTTPSYSYPY